MFPTAIRVNSDILKFSVSGSSRLNYSLFQPQITACFEDKTSVQNRWETSHCCSNTVNVLLAKVHLCTKTTKKITTTNSKHFTSSRVALLSPVISLYISESTQFPSNITLHKRINSISQESSGNRLEILRSKISQSG